MISPSGFNLLGQISFASLFLDASIKSKYNGMMAVVEHRTPPGSSDSIMEKSTCPLSLFCLRNETHEGLMVGLAVAQTHRRWNICVIVEEFTPHSKFALQC